MNDSYTNRRKEQRRTKDADQAEFEAIIRGSAVVDQGIYDDRVADALDDFEPEGLQPTTSWHRADLMVDTAVGQVHEEVERRQKWLGECYPFALDGGRLTYKASKSGFYEFCLAISIADQITAGEHVHLPRTFERLAAILVQHYLGLGATSLHVGSPRDPAIGTRFHEAMATAQRETREWFWSPQPGLPDQPNDTGDHGVDFIVWKAHPDGRVGSLFILGQCACGDDWIDKFNDIDLRRYGKWFNPICYVDPVRAFATPFHVADGFLTEALAQAGLMFDRVRLTHIAEAICEAAPYASWSNRIRELTRLVVDLPEAA